MYENYNRRKVTKIAKWVNDRARKKIFRLLTIIAGIEPMVPESLMGRTRRVINSLEIGCGAGELGVLLSGIGDYKGYDAGENNIEVCRAKGLKCAQKYIDENFQIYGEYSIIATMAFLEHIQYPTLDNLLKEIHKALKLDGVFLIHIPNLHDNHHEYWDACYTHCFPTTPYRMQRLLTDAGFKIVKQVHLYGSFPGYIGRLLRLPIVVAHKILKIILPDSIRYSEKFIKARMMVSDNHYIFCKK